MHETLMIIQAANSQIPQQTVVALIVVSALFVFGLLILLGMFVRRADDPMAYGSFFVVALGITTVLIGFLVTFPLIISGVFADPTQVLALLSALFGTIAGLVGTYFGVKASSDARQGLQDVATGASTSLAVVAVTPPRDAENVEPNTAVTATFSDDVDPTSIKDTDHFTLLRIDTQGTAHTPVRGAVDYGQPNFAPRVGAFVLPEAANLENDHTYQATITKGVRDLRGNTLAEDYAWQFKVRPSEAR
jgi:hypothetical protein